MRVLVDLLCATVYGWLQVEWALHSQMLIFLFKTTAFFTYFLGINEKRRKHEGAGYSLVALKVVILKGCLHWNAGSVSTWVRTIEILKCLNISEQEHQTKFIAYPCRPWTYVFSHAMNSTQSSSQWLGRRVQNDHFWIKLSNSTQNIIASSSFR
jgi:hypothetical protein